MSKIKNGGLDQYGAGPFEQQQFGTAGVEGVNKAVNRPQNEVTSRSRACKRFVELWQHGLAGVMCSLHGTETCRRRNLLQYWDNEI